MCVWNRVRGNDTHHHWTRVCKSADISKSDYFTQTVQLKTGPGPSDTCSAAADGADSRRGPGLDHPLQLRTPPGKLPVFRCGFSRTEERLDDRNPPACRKDPRLGPKSTAESSSCSSPSARRCSRGSGLVQRSGGTTDWKRRFSGRTFEWRFVLTAKGYKWGPGRSHPPGTASCSCSRSPWLDWRPSSVPNSGSVRQRSAGRPRALLRILRRLETLTGTASLPLADRQPFELQTFIKNTEKNHSAERFEEPNRVQTEGKKSSSPPVRCGRLPPFSASARC